MRRAFMLAAMLLTLPTAGAGQQPADADLAWADGDVDTAFRLYEARLAADSTDVTALHRVALVMAWTEQFAASLALLERATGLEPDDIVLAVDRARVIGWSGRHSQALEAVDRILIEAPTDPAALELRAQILSWSGDHEAYLAASDRLERLAPERARRHRLPRAEALAATGRLDDALDQLIGLLREAPDSAEVWSALESLAAAAVREGRRELALATYSRLSDHPGTPQPFLMAGARMLAGTGDFAAAVHALDRVLAVEPHHMEALEAKAQYTSWDRRFDDAIAAYDRLIAAAPDATRHRLQRARVLSWARQYAQAVEAYEQILADDPEHLDATLGLAQVLAWSRQFEAAHSLYERVLAADPRQTLAAHGLAQVAMWSGDPLEARARWTAILEHDPDDVTALVGLAATLGTMGRHRAAGRLIARADSLAPDHPDVAAARAVTDRALAPAVAPTLRHVSDSDGNRISTIAIDATAPLFGTVVLRGGTARSFLDQNGAFEHRVLSAHMGADAHIGDGWRLAGRVGIWQADGQDGRSRATGSLEVATPRWTRFRAGLGFQHLAHDVTALLVENRVGLQQITLDAAVAVDPRSTVIVSASTARFHATRSNTRLLGSARLDHRFGSAVTAGPAVRWFTFQKLLTEGYWNPDHYTLLELPIAVSARHNSLAPTIEVALGYQRIGQPDSIDSWSVAMRAEAGLTYALGPRRQIGVHAALANSGLDHLSPLGDGTYQYRGITLTAAWAF